MFIINITIRPIHTNTSPQSHAGTIVFVPHCHTPAATTVYPPLPPCRPTSSVPVSTSRHWLSTHSRQHNCRYPTPGIKWLWPFQNHSPSTQPNPQGWHPDLSKCFKWWNYSENHRLHQLIIPYYFRLPPYWSFQVPSSPSGPLYGRTVTYKILKTYIIMYRALSKTTPKTILHDDAPLTYKALWHVITEDNFWRILKHFLCKRPPHLVVRWRIFKNISAIYGLSIHKNLPILSTGNPYSKRKLSFPESMSPQTSSLNKVLSNLWPDKVYPLLLAPITPIFFIFSVNVFVQFSTKNTP